MRVLFKKREQRGFILRCIQDESIKNFLSKLTQKIPYSTFKKYSQEKLALPQSLFEELCRLSHQDPKKINYSILLDNWGAVKGGRAGMASLNKKYPHKIKEWRSLGGKSSVHKITNLKEIKSPLLDERLAEIIGVYLGDGTLTKYFLRISGDKRYDLPYFNYLRKIVKESTSIDAAIRESESQNVLYLDIRSKALCEMLRKDYGLNFGSKIKNRSIIPKEIIKEKRLFLSCLRGLMDTDGSISKDNNCLSARFSNHNTFLLNQVKKENKKYKIFSFENEIQIGIKSKEGVINYFKLIGSSNLRHITRFQEFLKGNLIKKESVLKYYSLYKDVSLPYNGPVV
ncbi:MAG: hypothetical protein KKE50_00010 [Nanoarchaeota archaeon]|nr:hypothetical protein [Nanoarchaeota archaeon]